MGFPLDSVALTEIMSPPNGSFAPGLREVSPHGRNSILIEVAIPAAISLVVAPDREKTDAMPVKIGLGGQGAGLNGVRRAAVRQVPDLDHKLYTLFY